MANRYLQQFQYTYEKDTVSIYGSVLIGNSGAVTSFQGAGVASVVKESADGQYTITLTDKFNRFLRMDMGIIDDAISQVSGIQILMDPASMQADIKSTKEIVIQCVGPTATADTALVAANPASGALIQFRIVMRNSSVAVDD